MIEKPQGNKIAIYIDHNLNVLLQRCAEIEERKVSEVVQALLRPYLRKYNHNSLEAYEEAGEAQEMQKLVEDFEADSGFDPNHIPFDLQILGLRRKLDELDREIKASTAPRPDLEKVRFSITEELNFAEREALNRQVQERERRSKRWLEVCKKFPLD